MSTQIFNDQWRMPNNKNQSLVSNYSMEFDGDFINIGNENYITTSSFNISISAWINIDTTSGDRTIVASGQSGSGAYDYRLNVDTNNNVYFSARTTSLTPFYTTITGGTTLSTNTWYHVCTTWDMANFNLYLNGVSDATAVSATNYYNDSGVKRIAIGYQLSSDAGGYRPFYGKIDAVSIYNYALSQSQVTTLYGSSSTGVGNPMGLSIKPVAYYQLGDETADNGANYLVPNSSLRDYVFDFNNDYVTLNSSINLTGNKTVSYWVNPNALNGNIYIGGVDPDYYTYMTSTQLAIKDSTGFSSFTISISTGNWYHICITGDGTNATLYINGDIIGTAADKNPTIDTIGGWSGGGGAINAKMSNVQIFNTTLPATGSNSVETLYNNGSPLTSMSGFTSLQGWWKLDATDTYDSSFPGNWTITDHSSNSNTGTSSTMTQADLVQSDLSFTNGYSPYALDFDGISNYIDCGNGTGISITGDLTLSAWVYLDNAPNPYMSIFSKMSSTTRNYTLYARSTRQLSITTQVSGGTIEFTTSNTAIPLNTWTHVVVTFNSGVTNGTKYYFNGTIDTVTGTHNTVADTSNLNIGKRTTSTQYLDGKISNASIWNAALTSTQVTELYNEGVPSNLNNHSAYSNLISWWQLGSNSSFNSSSWTVLDEKGTSNGVSSANMSAVDIVDGVGVTGNGLGATTIDIIGDAPYSVANSLSVNIDASDRVNDVPS